MDFMASTDLFYLCARWYLGQQTKLLWWLSVCCHIPHQGRLHIPKEADY